MLALLRLNGAGAAHLCVPELLRVLKLKDYHPGENSWPLHSYKGPAMSPAMFLSDDEAFAYWAPIHLEFVWVFGKPVGDSADSDAVNHYKLTGRKEPQDGGFKFVTRDPHVELHTNTRWVGAPGFWVCGEGGGLRDLWLQHQGHACLFPQLIPLSPSYFPLPPQSPFPHRQRLVSGAVRQKLGPGVRLAWPSDSTG